MKTCWKCGGKIKIGEVIKIKPKLTIKVGYIQCNETRYFHNTCYKTETKKERKQI